MLLTKTARVLVAISLVALVALPLAADDKDKPALSGVWGLKDREMKLEFADKDVLKISPHGKDEVILLVCKYTVDKAGVVKATISEVEGNDEVKEKAKGVLPVGLKFSFTWKVKDDTAKLDDLKGENVDSLRAHMEGEYEKK